MFDKCWIRIHVLLGKYLISHLGRLSFELVDLQQAREDVLGKAQNQRPKRGILLYIRDHIFDG